MWWLVVIYLRDVFRTIQWQMGHHCGQLSSSVINTLWHMDRDGLVRFLVVIGNMVHIHNNISTIGISGIV